MDQNIELKRKVAGLETKLDLIEAEFSYINRILMDCGFPEGIKTLKHTIEDMLAEGLDIPNEKPQSFEF